jgi:hypothetical protein
VGVQVQRGGGPGMAHHTLHHVHREAIGDQPCRLRVP